MLNVSSYLSPYLSPWEIKSVFKGHQIAAWLSARELKLYIDGQVVDSVKPFLWPRKEVALIRGSVKEGDQIHIVEVYGRSGLLRWPKVKICIDNKQIAGDEF